MVSLSRISYNQLTNFTTFLIKKPLNYQKTHRALFHSSLLCHGTGQEIKMPSLSPTMNEGKIVKWLKKEGDTLSPGEVLCDIETDKAVVSMEIEEEGILAKILVPENSTQIKVGSLIAMMVAEGEDWKNVDLPTEDTSKASSGSEPGKRPPNGTGGNATPGILVKMPSLSPTMTEGTILKWYVEEGSTIVPGDLLCDIQTDKAVMSLESEEEGILAKILVPNDTPSVKVGTNIAFIVGEGEDWKNVQIPTEQGSPVESVSKQESAVPCDSQSKKFGPAVKVLLSSYQIQSGNIQATGRGNRLLKGDVLKYVAENKLERKPQKASAVPERPTAPAPGRETQIPAPETDKKPTPTAVPCRSFTDIPLSNIRQVIARRLLQSKQEIPHSYAMVKCNVDPLLETKQLLAEGGIKVSVNDLITKSTATALSIYPKANVLWVDNQVQVPNDIDVCVAVATESGLFTPIIKSTSSKSITAISQEIRTLSEKAKTGKLKPEEFTGGTFTISNLGMCGITHFKAIINPPQCGILAVGTTTATFDHNMKIRKEIALSLSYDRRALDEAEAAEFMGTLKYVMENPKIILMGNQSASALGL